MPDSLATQLINGNWDDISKAVTEGLARGDQKNLSDVIPIDPGKLAASAWGTVVSLPAPAGISQVRSSAGSSTGLDFLHRLHLDYDALRAPPLDGIKAWAAAVRLCELSQVIKRLVTVATPGSCAPADLRAVPIGGWGQPRCLSFTPIPGAIAVPNLSSAGWDGPVSIDVPSPVGKVQVLIFRVGGGPYVRRPADLTPNWVPAGDIGVDLILAEQLEIIDASADTVVRVQLEAAG
jgi:hypothetical protein